MTVSPGIPGYEIARVIGEGGFATVYRGWQRAVGREVAVKVDNRVLLTERDRRRFMREVNAAGRLSGHPNVINIHDAGTLADGRPYMVMELCPGGSLADVLRRDGAVRPDRVRDIGIKIADGLAAAHAAGVLHRDVKPGNILLKRYGEVVLSDFGLASVLSPDGDQSVTREALTPAYGSPERFQGLDPTVACDLYSLAATLYALLAGRPPRFPADGRRLSLGAIAMLHGQSVEDIPGVPPGLMAILRQNLAADPARRSGSAAALRDALRAADPPAPAARPRDGDEAGAGTSDQAGDRARTHAAAARPARVTGVTGGRAAHRAPARHAHGRAGDARPAPGVAGPGTRRRRPRALLVALGAGAAIVIGAGAFLGALAFSPSPKAAALTQEDGKLIERVDDTKQFTGCVVSPRPAAGAKSTITCQASTPGITMTAASFALTDLDQASAFSPGGIAGESAGLNSYLKAHLPGGFSPAPSQGGLDPVCIPRRAGTCPSVGGSQLWGSPEPVLGRLYCYHASGTYQIAWTFDNDEYETQYHEDFAIIVSSTSEAALLRWWRQNAGL